MNTITGEDTDDSIQYRPVLRRFSRDALDFVDATKYKDAETLTRLHEEAAEHYRRLRHGLRKTTK